jgi:hypothetical protein
VWKGPLPLVQYEVAAQSLPNVHQILVPSKSPNNKVSSRLLNYEGQFTKTVLESQAIFQNNSKKLFFRGKNRVNPCQKMKKVSKTPKNLTSAPPTAMGRASSTQN